MQLSSLIPEGARLTGDGAVEIGGLCVDSRTVRAGDLFAALGGTKTDGRQFVADAVAKGAVAVLGPVGLAASGLTVPVVEAAEPRLGLARMAARFFGAQPETVVAVTGTNGKTSTAVFTRQIWERLGLKAASLGTLGLHGPSGYRPGALTTPDAIVLHRIAAEVASAGVRHFAIEASSHGLDQHRLDALRLAAGAFTNLTRDHFDYHGTEAAYFAAKRRLFGELLPAGAAAVLNADVPQFAVLADDARRRGLRLVDYGRAANVLRLAGQTLHGDGQTLDVEVDGRPQRIELPLVGPFHAWNALAALGLVIGTGGDVARAVEALGHLVGAPGRMELVARRNGASAYVDYAHTPDALEQALKALRAHTGGRLVVVFGCGGDRDPGKRPLMGGIAGRLADRVIVTDDNPRSEDPASIRRAVLAAAGPKAVEVGDRAAAIEAGFAGLRTGDVLLVAGKGHETGQTAAGRTLPFDDAAVCRQIAGPLSGAAA